ncbi:MAG: hypothetical protein KAJ07_03440 [Planctomycetes bacterium]|nr:hypothetical protein [Planctomycetota bacterium]
MPVDNHPFISKCEVGVPAPLLPIRIINPKNGGVYPTFALLDTGATSTAIPGYIADDLGIVVESVKPKEVFGIAGKAWSYPHPFIIEVLAQNPDATNSADECKLIRKLQGKIEVIKGLGVTVLGAWDFMNRYVITVDYPKLDFSVKLPKRKKT